MPNTPQNAPTRRNVEIVAFPHAQLLDVTGPFQVFASANALATERGVAPPYDVRVVAHATPVRTSAGLDLAAHPLSRHGRPIDTLIVAGGMAFAQPQTISGSSRG